MSFGLGMLDETETDSVQGARALAVDHETGEILDAVPATSTPPSLPPSPDPPATPAATEAPAVGVRITAAVRNGAWVQFSFSDGRQAATKDAAVITTGLDAQQGGDLVLPQIAERGGKAYLNALPFAPMTTAQADERAF